MKWPDDCPTCGTEFHEGVGVILVRGALPVTGYVIGTADLWRIAPERHTGDASWAEEKRIAWADDGECSECRGQVKQVATERDDEVGDRGAWER